MDLKKDYIPQFEKLISQTKLNVNDLPIETKQAIIDFGEAKVIWDKSSLETKERFIEALILSDVIICKLIETQKKVDSKAIPTSRLDQMRQKAIDLQNKWKNSKKD